MADFDALNKTWVGPLATNAGPNPAPITFTPEEQEDMDRTEANPALDDELDTEMARPDEQSPANQAALQEEKDRRGKFKDFNPPKKAFDDFKPPKGAFADFNPPKSFSDRLLGDYKSAKDQLSATGDQVKSMLNPDSLGDQMVHLGGLAFGAGKTALTSGLQSLNVLGQGLASVVAPAQQYMNGGMVQNTKDNNDAISAGLDNLPGMETPSAKLGEQAMAVPFAGIKTIVESVAPEHQEALNQLLSGAMLLIGAKFRGKAIETAESPTPLADRIQTAEPPASDSAPRQPPQPTDLEKVLAKQEGKDITTRKTNGGPEIGLQPDQPVPPEPTPPILEPGTYEGRTPDLFGTEEVGRNPFLDPSKLEVDENGIPRLKGESRDVQREASDYPSTDDILQAANEHLADQAERATPETQDQVTAQQLALWEAEEANVTNKASQSENMWRDHAAKSILPRIPALKETLENPLGNNRSTAPQSRVTPNPRPGLSRRRPISNRGGLNRQRGAVDLSGDGYGGWFDKDDLKGKNLTEISTALFRRYAPDVELGENRARRMGALAESKGNMPVPKLEVEKIGDTWTVVNHDGRHRSDTLLKDGVGKMPVELTGDVEQFLKDNPKEVRSQDMQTMLPNPAFKMEAGPNPIDPNGIYSSAEHYDGRPKSMQEADRAVRTGNPNFGKFKQGGGINPDEIPDFRKWFGRSLLKDESGKPIILYHGTSKDTPFDNLKENSRGIYLTKDPKEASSYALENDSMGATYSGGEYTKTNTASRVMPVYARLENPYILTDAERQAFKYAENYKKFQRDMLQKAKALGHDGIIYPDSIVVFDRSQVKSAISGDARGPSMAVGPGKKQQGGLNLDAFFGKGTPRPIAEAISTPDNRSGIQFARDMLAQAAQKTMDTAKDIKSQLGMHTGSWRAVLEAINNPNSVNHQTALFFSKKIGEYVSELHAMNAGSKAIFEKAYGYYGIHHLNRFVPQTFKLNDFKNDLGIALKMEGGFGWFDKAKNNYVPSVADLQKAGMSPKSAQVWHGIHTALDAAWDTMVKTTDMATKVHIPDRVPGYLPHVFKGPFVVRVSKGAEGSKSYYLTHNSFTAKEALAYKAKIEPAMKAQGYDVSYEPPTAENTAIPDLFRGMWEAKDIFEKNQAMSKLMKGLFESSAQGIVSSVLDRSNPTQLGHALQRVGLTGMEGLDVKGVKAAFQSIEATVHDVNNWYNKVKFVNEILHPLDSQGLLQAKNLQKTVQNWTMQFMDMDNSLMHPLDAKLRDMMINMGQDPRMIANFISKTGGIFAKIYLVGKPAFYAANRLQSTLIPSTLMMLQAQNGGKGSIWRAFADAKGDLLNAQTFSKKSPLLQRGLKDGYISPSFIDNMGPDKFKDPVAAYIEETTRAESYAAGYHYFKQFMSEEDSFKAAGQFADMVSVPYDKAFGAPTLFTRLPASMKPLAMFATYNQHMLGLTNAMLRTAVEAKRQGEYGAMLKSASAIVVAQGLQAALFGFGGITMMQNWDNIADKVQRYFGWNWKTSKEFARDLGKYSPSMAQIGEYGLSSKALNMDISPSGSGASIQSPLAFTDMVADIVKLGIYTLGSVAHNRFSKEDAWDTLKTMPPTISGLATHFLRSEGVGTFYKQAIGEVKDYSVGQEGIHAKGTELTPAESVMSWFGAKSPRLSDIAETDRELRRYVKSNQVNADSLINMLQESHPPIEVRRQAVKMLSQMYDVQPSQIISALEKYQLESNTTSDTRRAMAATGGISAAERFKQYLELKGQQPYQ